MSDSCIATRYKPKLIGYPTIPIYVPLRTNMTETFLELSIETTDLHLEHCTKGIRNETYMLR